MATQRKPMSATVSCTHKATASSGHTPTFASTCADTCTRTIAKRLTDKAYRRADQKAFAADRLLEALIERVEHWLHLRVAELDNLLLLRVHIQV